MLEVLFFCVCAISALAGAISGIGGGVIIKPVLDLLSGQGVVTISFLSGCAVLSMSIVALLRMRSAQQGNFETKRGTSLALGAAVGGVAGKLIFDVVRGSLQDDFVSTAQSLILCVIVIFLIFYQMIAARVKTHNITNVIICAVIGLCMGTISAFLGIGGGPFNLAILAFFFSMETKKAAYHSLYIILFSQLTSLISTIVQGEVPPVTPLMLISVIAGGILGGLLGSQISKKMQDKQVSILYMCVLVAVLFITGTNLVRV